MFVDKSIESIASIYTSCRRVYILLWDTLIPFVELFSRGRRLIFTVSKFDLCDWEVDGCLDKDWPNSSLLTQLDNVRFIGRSFTVALLFNLCSLVTLTKYLSVYLVALIALMRPLFLSIKYFPNGSVYLDWPRPFAVFISLLLSRLKLFFIRMFVLLLCYNIVKMQENNYRKEFICFIVFFITFIPYF